MSHPFMIWTMQRTGGTTLADLLMDMSEHRRAQHEPFNFRQDTGSTRQFGHIHRAWAGTRDDAALVKALADIFAQRYLIKHCYEFNPEFSLRLAEVAATSGYRHIHLLRRNEALRLISRFVAEAHETWFQQRSTRVFTKVIEGQHELSPLPVKAVVEHYRRCERALNDVRQCMRKLDLDVREIDYEDLYVGEREARTARLDALLAFLDFSPEVIERNRSKIERKIFKGGQDTASVMQFVPNLGEVLEALAAAGCPPPPERGVVPEPEARSAAMQPAPSGEAFPIADRTGPAPRRVGAASAMQQGGRDSFGATGAEPQPRTLRAALPGFDAIAGLPTADEAEQLFYTAAAVVSGCIVEVGSYRGRSTLALCAGSSAGTRRPVYAVEPHEQPAGTWGAKVGPKDRAAFFRNFLKAGLVRHVRLLNAPSAVVAAGWKEPVGLLCLNGEDRNASAEANFAAWQPHLAPGATVAFYDSGAGNHGGGAAAAIGALVEGGTLQWLRRSGKLGFLQFTGRRAPARRRIAGPATPTVRPDEHRYKVPWRHIGRGVYYGGNGAYLYQPIPKCACTTIKTLLLEFEGLPVDENLWQRHSKKYNNFLGTSHLSDQEQLNIFEGRTDTFKFVMVRSPYARLASVYCNKILKGPPHWVKQVAKASLEQGMALSDPISFEEFVAIVSRQSPRQMDPHWRAQYYVGRFQTIKFDFVGRMEMMPDHLIYALERIGAPEHLIERANERYNVTGSDLDLWGTVSADVRKKFLDTFAIDFDTLHYPSRLHGAGMPAGTPQNSTADAGGIAPSRGRVPAGADRLG